MGIKKWLVRLVLPVLCVVFAFSIYKLADIKVKQNTEQGSFYTLASSVEALRRAETAEIDAWDMEGERSQTDAAGAEASEAQDQSVLPEYALAYADNPDLFGWIRIEGTLVDYPVMYTPEDGERYLHRAYDGSISQSGTPFIDAGCDPCGSFYLIYGHRMKSGTMFGTLPSYADRTYRDAHSIICFDTLYERREYEVIAAFASKIYGEDEVGFRYYEYTDLSEHKVFEEYMTGVMSSALYDTKAEISYGDELITLSTCSYHTEDGRFVVVAKRIL